MREDRDRKQTARPPNQKICGRYASRIYSPDSHEEGNRTAVAAQVHHRRDCLHGGVRNTIVLHQMFHRPIRLQTESIFGEI